MVGWHHRLNGHGFGWTPGVGDGQGGLVCCGSWNRKKSDTTEWLNWTEMNWREKILPRAKSLFLEAWAPLGPGASMFSEGLVLVLVGSTVVEFCWFWVDSLVACVLADPQIPGDVSLPALTLSLQQGLWSAHSLSLNPDVHLPYTNQDPCSLSSLTTNFTWKKKSVPLFILFLLSFCALCVCVHVCVCVCFFLLRLISLLHMSILDERFCYILTVSLPGAQVLPCSPRCLDY